MLHVLLAGFYLYAQHEIATIPAAKLDTLVLFVGLIVIAPITSNFIYSYEKAQTKASVMWGTVTTFFSMLVIGALFSVLDVLLLRMIGNVLVFRTAILLFWVAVVTFDFADFYLLKKKD